MNIRTSLIALAVISLIGFGSGCNSTDQQINPAMNPNTNNPQDTTTSTLDAAPDFTLTSYKGGSVSLSDFSGKPLVIFFLGNTCPLCISSGPKIQSDIREAFSETDVAMIGIDVWDGNIASLQGFQSRTGVTFDLLLKGSDVGATYSTTYDRLVVVNAKGEIAFNGMTAAQKDIPDVVTLLKQLTQ